MSSYNLTTNVPWSQTMRELANEFKLWGVHDWETNYPKGARWEGYQSQDEITRAVTLRYVKDGKTVNLSMGKQKRAVDNLRVLYLAINSIRLNEKRGIGEVLASAYKQLSAPEGEIFIDPYEFLGIRSDAPLEVAEAVYKSLATKYHPDSKPSGSAEKMVQLNEAIKRIREEKAKP